MKLTDAEKMKLFDAIDDSKNNRKPGHNPITEFVEAAIAEREKEYRRQIGILQGELHKQVFYAYSLEAKIKAGKI